jgi:hypothetical protein
MTEASSDIRRTWTPASNERPNSLEIILLKRSFVLPWNQFLYAEGGEDEVRLAFSTHDILVSGNHLGLLLADLEGKSLAGACSSREIRVRYEVADNQHFSPKSGVADARV